MKLELAPDAEEIEEQPTEPNDNDAPAVQKNHLVRTLQSRKRLERKCVMKVVDH